MIPKEKARELVSKMSVKIPAYPDYLDIVDIDVHVEAAIIVVDEILETLEWPPVQSTFEPRATYEATVSYWKMVKKHLVNMDLDNPKSADDIFHEGLTGL
jgi:hypothetical protein